MFEKLKNYEISGHKVFLEYEGSSLRPCVEVIADNLVNVFVDYSGQGHRSRAVGGEYGERAEAKCGKLESVALAENGLIIKSRELTVIVRDGFAVDFYDREGRPISLAYRGERKKNTVEMNRAMQELLAGEGHETLAMPDGDYPVQEVRAMEKTDCIYGLGDKTGFLNKRNYEYEMWNSDLPDPQEDNFKALYKSIPFMMVLGTQGAYGIFFDNHGKSYFNLGKECSDYYVIGADGGNLDYYFIAGQSLKEVISDYTWLTGRAPMQQLWTLGYHQSRWGYESEEKIRDVAKKLRENHLPCDCIHFDIDYMDHYKVFTWNKETYQDEAKVISDLKEMGIKAVTIIDPGVKVEAGYSVYEEGVKNGYFATTPEGDIYVNAVWPGDAVFPDFGNPKVRKWWGEKQKYLIDLGVAGVWNDMNEPASFKGPLPADVVFTDEDRPAPHSEIHNIYGHNMAKATYEGWREFSGKRPFVITRACYSGTQKYAVGWTGDNHSIWAHLRMAIPQMCNMGMSGMNFIGTDVGGFGSDATPELFARWMEVGCFSPLFRNHCALGRRYQEPWQFGEEVLAISKKYINLRYELLPYLYDLMRETERTGIPMLRPLVLEYDRDENVKNRNDEFMLGDRLLVAPVVEQGAMEKLVYLPAGVWYDYWTGERKEGGAFFVRKAPLDTCPIYVKEGAVIPKYPVRLHTGPNKDELLILEAYPGEGSYIHYQDNGEDFQYRDGAYNEYKISHVDGKTEIEKIHDGYKDYEKIEIVPRFC
ncbi:MAG: glycoside hydrolase family 31 protein [Clostridium sp.]|nr:glycoside hydrolase family 31 protein [Clostridium sp.]